MSKPSKYLSGNDAIDQFVQVKKGATKTRTTQKAPATAPLRVPTPSVAHASKKRVVDDDTAFFSMEDVHLTFHMSAYAYIDFATHAAEVQKLLWHEDESTFGHLGSETTGQASNANIFKGLQSVIYLTNKVRVLESLVNELKSDNTTLNKEVNSLKKRITELENVEKERDALVKSRDVDEERLKAALAEVDAVQANMETNCKLASLRTEVMLREQLLKEYEEGWDGESICAAAEKLRLMNAEDAAEADADDLVGEEDQVEREDQDGLED